MSEHKTETEQSPETILLSGEKWWRSKYGFLQKRGYRLRTRYQPGWRPSWLGSGKSEFRCEDSHPNDNDKTIDAVQISSGKTVCLKVIDKKSKEKNIAQYLYSETMRNDPRNHCVPILDTFEDEEELEKEFIVMPILRNFNSPPFEIVSEALDFIRQMLEAVVFLHEKNVAHRDLSTLNIMYNAERVYPEGYHPAATILTTDVQAFAPYISRTEAGGVKYYITDFGISTHFKDGEDHLVLGAECQDDTVPELSETVPYDPFLVDIYTLGNVFKEDLLETFKNINCIKPLVQAMTEISPKSRPTATETLQLFEGIAKRQPIHVVQWKLKNVESNRIVHAYQNIVSLGVVSAVYARKLLRVFRKAP